MAGPGGKDLERRMAELIQEADGARPAAPAAPLEQRGTPRGTQRISLAAGAGMALALLIGMQLGGLPWKFRREMWQAQGVVVGLVAGFVIGRLSSRQRG